MFPKISLEGFFKVVQYGYICEIMSLCRVLHCVCVCLLWGFVGLARHNKQAEAHFKVKPFNL